MTVGRMKARPLRHQILNADGWVQSYGTASEICYKERGIGTVFCQSTLVVTRQSFWYTFIYHYLCESGTSPAALV